MCLKRQFSLVVCFAPSPQCVKSLAAKKLQSCSLTIVYRNVVARQLYYQFCENLSMFRRIPWNTLSMFNKPVFKLSLCGSKSHIRRPRVSQRCKIEDRSGGPDNQSRVLQYRLVNRYLPFSGRALPCWKRQLFPTFLEVGRTCR